MRLVLTSEALDYSDGAAVQSGIDAAGDNQTWRDGSVRIGIHTSIAGDIAGALESARKLGCNALQIFSASPRMWPRAGSGMADADAARFRARREELGLGPVVIHANYLINLASLDAVVRARSIEAFQGEIVRARALGADFLVVHPGCALGAASAEAVRAVAQALREAFRGARVASVSGSHSGSDSGGTGSVGGNGLRVLLENTAGMGSAVGNRFEELRSILDEAAELPLGVCIDTAHAFAAGYPIHTADGLDRTIEELDRVVGLKRVAVLHVNDSKAPFGSRVDRHEQIGRGKIGMAAFRRILTHPRLSLAGRGFILENPIDAPGDDRRIVRTAWKLAGFSVKQAPRAENGFTTLRRAREAAPAQRRTRRAAATRRSKQSPPNGLVAGAKRTAAKRTVAKRTAA